LYKQKCSEWSRGCWDPQDSHHGGNTATDIGCSYDEDVVAEFQSKWYQIQQSSLDKLGPNFSDKMWTQRLSEPIENKAWKTSNSISNHCFLQSKDMTIMWSFLQSIEDQPNISNNILKQDGLYCFQVSSLWKFISFESLQLVIKWSTLTYFQPFQNASI